MQQGISAPSVKGVGKAMPFATGVQGPAQRGTNPLPLSGVTVATALLAHLTLAVSSCNQ